MNHKLVLRSLLGVLLIVVLLEAGQPWEEKPFTEWTDKECSKVFTDSPWARPVPLRGGVTTLGSVEVVVQWASALTVQQAIARQRQLEADLSEAETSRFLATPRPDFVIGVFGPALRLPLFQKAREEVVRDATYMERAPGKQKISPAAVRFVRRGTELTAMEFRFPRHADNQPLIGPEAQKVKFHCQVGDGFISADFDLRKMVRDGKPDL